MLKRLTLQGMVFGAVMFLVASTPPAGFVDSWCDELNGVICSNMCEQLSQSEREDAYWENSMSSAILSQPEEWYEENCVVQASCSDELDQCFPQYGVNTGIVCFYNH